MRISTDYFTNNFIYNVDNLAQQQNKLQTQASTGLKVTLPEDDPAVMTQVLNLQSASAQNTRYQSNISALQNAATNSYTAMNNLKSISDQVDSIATKAANGLNAAQLPTYAASVTQYIQQALAQANTQDANGNYIFGGTASGSPPFVATQDANGNYTAITYQGNSDAAQSEVAQNVTVAAQTPGANTSGAGPRGLITDSRYGADFFNHLISLQQNLTSGNTAAISSTDVPALNKDETNIISQISANSVMQATLANASNIATAKSTNFTTQISNSTNADLATTLTQLQQTQTAYQAALESGSKVMSVSLLDYIH